MPSYKFDEAIAAGVPIGDINAEAAKRIGYRYDDAKKAGISDDDIHAELRKRYAVSKPEEPKNDYNFGEGAIGLGETALSLATGMPGFVAGSLGKAKALLTGKTTAAELDQAAKAATPEIFNKITYEPRTNEGKVLTEGVSKAFEMAGEGLGATGSGLRAGVEAAIEGSGQTGAQRKFKEYQEVVAPVTKAMLEIGMVGKGAKDLRDNYVQKQQDTVRKLVVEEEAKNQKSIAQEQEPSLPELPEAPPIIPGSWKEGMTPKEVETPLPVLPDTLNIPPLEPSSLGGTGKSGFGQGGAINFGFGEKVKKAFSPKTFEEFAKDFYEKNPDLANTSESSVRAAYEKMYPMKSKGALQAKAFGDLVGDKNTYNKYESRPVMDDPLGEKSVERMKGLSGADSEPLGVVKSNVMSAGRMPSWMSKSPIIHEGIQFITSVKDHYRVKSADTMSPINKMFNGSERGLSQFVKGIKDTWREAAEVLAVRREHEFDPNFDPKTQFSGKQLELFNKIDETLKNLYTEINARRKQLDPKAQDLPQLPYYFTSFFKGDWAVPVFDSTTGQFLFNLRETKKADAIKAQEWVNQQQGMMAKEVGLLKQSKYVDKKMDAASDFDTLLKTFGSNDPAVVAAMQRLANSSKRKAGNTAGMPNRFLNKEGRFGSLGDKPWLSDKENYYGNKEALTRYVDGANDWLAHTQIAKFSEGMLKSEKDINAPNAVRFIQDYSDYVIGKKEIASQITKGVDSAISHFFNRSTGDATSGVRTWANALTAQYIGYFSPRAMIQNVFQPISATVPKMLEMGLMEGYKGNPFTALMVGMVEGVLDSVGHATHLPYKTQTLKFKEANHVVDAHLVESGGTFKNVFANDLYDAAANFSVAATEALARSQGFSIFYHYLKSSGMDSAKAMDMAKNLTKEHMVNYEQYAKPQMFGATGIVGEMAGRLQTYKMNATTQMAEYLTKMNHNPKTWVPFSTALGINIALAGAMGVMGMDVAELLWKGVQLADQKITGGTNEIQEWTPKRFIFETLPSSVSMGALSTATGMDLTGAFAQNLVGDNAAQSVMPIVGGMVNQVAAVPQLLSSTNDADTAKALSAFTPTTGKPYVERAFSTMKRPDGDTQVLSPTTGNTVYKGPDQGYAKGTTGLITGEGLLSNIRTLDRGYKAYENKFDTEYNHGISVRLKGIEDKTNKVVNDVVKSAVAGKDNPFAKATIGKNFIKYVEIGGDPNDLLNKINSHVQSLAIGDKLVEELSKDITLRNRKQIQHAFELYQRRQEHGSATTSK